MMQSRPLADVDVVAEGLGFPEGPVALSDGSVLVVELRRGLITRIDADGSKDVVADVGGGPNGLALGPDGALYVCNNGGFGDGPKARACIQRVDLSTGTSEVLYVESNGRPLVAPNDLVFDASGGFWFTDFRGDAVHYARHDGTDARQVLSRIPRPNGVGLSPDGTTLYWAQTETRQVMRRAIETPGTLVASVGLSTSGLARHGSVDRATLLVGLPGCMELDSLAVDSSGAVCVGTLIDGCITEIPPTCQSHDDVTRWELPPTLADGLVTNLAFGGPDLRTAYITCSQSGRLLRCTWHRPGLALAFP